MRAGSAMPPVLLEDDEAVAVAVALRAAAGSIAQMDEAAMGVLAKIDQVMPARLRKRASSLHSVTVSLPAALEMPAADVLMQIAGACRDQKKLTIGYADRAGRPSARQIEPVRLAHTGRRWYLVAWDVDRKDWRTFRADRIGRIVEPGTHFKLRASARQRAREADSELDRRAGAARRAALRAQHRRTVARDARRFHADGGRGLRVARGEGSAPAVAGDRPASGPCLGLTPGAAPSSRP